HMSLSNVSVVAFHYRSYGTFCIYSKRLHNLYSGFTHYRNYRAWKFQECFCMQKIPTTWLGFSGDYEKYLGLTIV
ncbi:hypothetical protein ACTGW0_03760, partial [Streptococcus suis]